MLQICSANHGLLSMIWKLTGANRCWITSDYVDYELSPNIMIRYKYVLIMVIILLGLNVCIDKKHAFQLAYTWMMGLYERCT